ncbi:Protein JOKA2 like protein [Verticillium longisporum]|uniref:Protein JOKA2 like protein n=1 Tax=Verticillium longisporum TaxID=100787 RepID=A0A0G4NF00_VERLO|nr:Protein JOKA2 like protein [Verticillium longisporum]KAG7137513.1 Protein JOKA2 like protein [Verticillium longisporum]CRK44954.1 hypothetical protein BN1723_016429 [Verticillium longisporum]
MASESASIPSAKKAPSAPRTATEDLPVTVKVLYEGVNQRFGFVLRDVGVSTLETKIREFLKIPVNVPVLLERYSDSAAAYVVLDPSNTSVYKQLYRAAKAKQKLKLRVAVQRLPERTLPRSVTVEDCPEVSTTLAAVPSPAPQPEAYKPPVPPKLPTVFDVLRATEPKTETKDEAPKHQLPMTDLVDDFETSLLASLMQRHANMSDINHKEPISNPEAPTVPEHDPCMGLYFRTAAGQMRTKTLPTLNFAVCCNSCDKTIPDSHYHCSTCDDGDFDLCQSCVEQGITCYSDSHWLIKRALHDGQIITSTTETIAPKPKKEEPAPAEKALVPIPKPFLAPLPILNTTSWAVRTCNCCVNELPETRFLHCTTCEDFDLCHACFSKDAHGHHPKHAFTPAVEAAYVSNHLQVRLSAGRNQVHNAICDGCDKYICGVRHKCLDCPDWDYCSECIVNAKFVHANHRFVPVYEPLEEARARCTSARQVHYGICCDGPLCSSGNAPTYITGTRYKCTVCHDTDFCANCEASPALEHNKTHPLVQFKTPVRHVTVTTTGEHGNGNTMPQLGDRSFHRAASRSSDTKSMASVQTVVDVKPIESMPIKEEVVEKKSQPKAEEKPLLEKDLVAVFVSDTIADGTTMAPNSVFQQTWNLRNEGDVAWPAGCSVKFVGGDYMGHVDSNQPAGISELVSASESTICYESLAPGQEAPFTVLLRTPPRDGKVISYWRLTTSDGMKFGHRLWCDIDVRTPKDEVKSVPTETADEEHAEEAQTSQMIFPKLEKESPVASMHQDVKSETAASSTLADVANEVDDFEDCGRVDDWEGSDDGFMTDEEYDILDASDEEFLEEQQKRLRK